jgi:hypothetical protein
MSENVISTSSPSWHHQPNIVRALMAVERLTPCGAFGVTRQAATRIHYPAAVHVLNDFTVQKILSHDSDALAENTMRYLEQAFLFGESDC